MRVLSNNSEERKRARVVKTRQRLRLPWMYKPQFLGNGFVHRQTWRLLVHWSSQKRAPQRPTAAGMRALPSPISILRQQESKDDVMRMVGEEREGAISWPQLAVINWVYCNVVRLIVACCLPVKGVLMMCVWKWNLTLFVRHRCKIRWVVIRQ